MRCSRDSIAINTSVRECFSWATVKDALGHLTWLPRARDEGLRPDVKKRRM